MDLSPLRPHADTPDGMIEAIGRCMTAAKGCLALHDQLKRERVSLLLAGGAGQLSRNAADLAAVVADGVAIGELVDALRTRLIELAPEQAEEIDAQKRAMTAAGAMTAWWLAHGPLVLEGLRTMGAAFAALAELQQAAAKTNAAAEAARAAAVNVVPLSPRPV